MSTIESENGATSQYVPFTPFQERYAFETEPTSVQLVEPFETAQAFTPFVSEYAGVESRSPETTEMHDLLLELYDQEFDEVLAELAHQAWEAVNERSAPFGETGTTASAEQFLREWSEPVRRQAEAMLDTIAEAAGEHDLASMSEAEVDSFFERFEPRATGLEPYFENFLGGLWNKVKSVAKKVVDVAKKGITLIPGVGLLISKLKGLVKPILERVLKMAIDKLPAPLQPYARQLAERFLGAKTNEAGEDHAAAPAAPDVSEIQQQFDLEAAMLMFAGDETQQEVVLGEAASAVDREDAPGVAQLHEARERFVDELERGVDPQQALEQFIPAVMAILPIARTVIGIIGRKNVVGTLAKFLDTTLVGRYIPEPAALQLSQAVVDAGLKMLSLETPAEADARSPRLAYETVTQTVEDTVRRVSELDESTFEDPARFEAALTEAFHRSAAENFPPQLIVPELHEASLRAAWVAMPAGRRRKYYRKYTQTFDVELTQQTADAVKTFGGTALSAFLKDQLGVTPPVHAKVHLYQAIPGTTLRRIASCEKGVPGLGTSSKAAAMQIHPLTVEAASALIQQPKLGRDVHGSYRSSRRCIAVGARFYYLEIAGARPVTVPGAAGAQADVRRTSEVNLTLDFPKDEFRVFAYLSETSAQEIAAGIRKQDLTSVLVLAKRVYEAGVQAALAGDIERHVKILTEATPQEQLFGIQLRQLAEIVKQRLAAKVVDWIGQAFSEYVKSGAGELVAATEDPADGVTIVVQIANPPGAPLVRKLLNGEGIGALGDLGSAFKGTPRFGVKTVAGFRFD
jgi:hypothetical protein